MSGAANSGNPGQTSELPVLTKDDLKDRIANSKTLAGFDFNGMDLVDSGVSLEGQKLDGSDLTSVKLQSVKLSGASLRNACLKRAESLNADFRNADLRDQFQELH